MIERLKAQFNKKYTTISVYVIFTVLIIFALAYTATQIDGIFRVIGGSLSYITKLLTPVFIGIVIAYILDPLVAVFEKLYKRVKFLKLQKIEKYRSLSVFSCIIVILFVIFLLVGIFIFSITKQISGINMEDFIKVTTNYINSFSESLKGIEGNLAAFNIESNALEQYIVQLSTILMTTLSNFANNLTTNALNISGYVSNFIFGLIIAIYLLLDKKEFLKYGDIFSRALFSDKVQKKIKSYWHDFDNIFSGYIRGQLLDALFMSVVLSLSLSIIGIKFGALIGVLAGLCNLIPYFGPIVAFAGTVFFGVLNAQYSRVIIAIVALLIVQQIDGTIIGPKLLGNSVSLKPVFILIAVIVGAGIGGVAGMVLAVPVAALIKLFIKRFIEERLKEKELQKDNSIDSV